MASTSKAQERPTSLKGKKDSFEFEIWVEIDGKPLEAYGVTEGEDGVPEAWIASEAGKVSICVSITGWQIADFRERPQAYAVAVRMKNTDFVSQTITMCLVAHADQSPTFAETLALALSRSSCPVRYRRRRDQEDELPRP
jgi:hypothetical protein